MNDLISRQAAIDAIEEYADRLQMVDWKENPGVPYKAYALNWCINTIRDLPSAQPEYYDYSDIEPLWKSFAEENDINLTSTAKQLKDAMWVGYRKGKQAAQPERKKGKWTEDNACPFCGFQPWYERDIHTLSFCPNCGARMTEEDV